MILNEDQEKAVKYNRGPLLIIAGAGTGKTTVIVEKIKYLLTKKLALPEEILALTFTEKAAYEMEERVDQELPYGYYQISISTFHSFAEQILKEQGDQIGINNDFKLITKGEEIIFLKKNLFLFDFNYIENLNSTPLLTNLLNHFSRLKDEDIDPDSYLNWIKKKLLNKNQDNENELNQYLDLAKSYKKYQQIKLKENLLDFSDLIYYLNILFKKKPSILKKYQKQFKYILIDEFQDTNISQYNLIKLLSPPNKNPFLTVVGDDSQAIYKFRGASVSNILNFMKNYKKAKIITLLKNYRSNQIILDTAYKLIKNNDPDTLEFQLGISKKLISNQKTNENNQPINFFYGENLQEEINYVIKQIKTLTKTYQYQDIAILYRANNHIDPFIKAFSKNNLPFQFLGTGYLFKQPEIKDLIAYLKILYNLEDDLSLYRVLSMSIINFDSQDLNLLINFSKKISLSLYLSIETYLVLNNLIDIEKNDQNYEIYKPYLPLFKKETKEKLKFIYQLIKKHLNLSKKFTAGEILYDFLEKTRYLNILTNIKSEKQEKLALNISKFFNFIRSFENNYQDASVNALVEFLEISLEIDESPLISDNDLVKENAINLLTVHSAKGLEFPVVFLINLINERFPTRERKEKFPIPDEIIKEILPTGNYHLQEERRLFYVGLTRAKDKLFLTASQYYGEGVKKRKISPFVYEALSEELIKKIEIFKNDEKNQLSIFSFKPSIDNKNKNQISILKNNNNQIKNFSYTKLDTFNLCPLKYKYQYILKLPTPYSSIISFGNSIHKTLQIFYQKFKKNNSISEKDLIDIYHKNWIPLGYSSFLQQQKNKQEGEKILKKFFNQFHNQNINILDIEKPFKIKILTNTYLTGKIDRVDIINKNEIEIIDYKTGKKPDEKKLNNNPQLLLYALAASDKNLYNKKPENINLTFFYLNKKIEKFTFKKKFNDIERFKEKIIEQVEKINQSDFKPKVGSHCDFCPFRLICDAW